MASVTMVKPGQVRRARPTSLNTNTKHSQNQNQNHNQNQTQNQNHTQNQSENHSRTHSTRAATTDGDGSDAAPKRLSEPHVRDTAYILRKFRGRPPSLVLHLHPTHFRFDQQDGSFSYDSPMKPFLHHLRRQTVPHDFLRELFDNNVPFYDGASIPCLLSRALLHSESA